jgi:hypothetical protein
MRNSFSHRVISAPRLDLIARGRSLSLLFPEFRFSITRAPAWRLMSGRSLSFFHPTCRGPQRCKLDGCGKDDAIIFLGYYVVEVNIIAFLRSFYL